MKSKILYTIIASVLINSSSALFVNPNYDIKIQSDTSNVYESLKRFGFCEIGNRKFLKGGYNELYQDFNNFIEEIDVNTALSENIANFEQEFLNITDYKKQYCSAPPSYRDPKRHVTKRFNKIYFQFIKEHYDLIKEKHTDILKSNPTLYKFLENMNALDSMSRELFKEIVASIDVGCPGIKDILYGRHEELTIISKIIRYKKTEGWGTTPHCDKSSLSLIWDSNDDNDDSLVICEDLKNPNKEKLKKPYRIFSGLKDITSTLLITGTTNPKVGIELDPLVHGVLPIDKEYRYAVISFLLIPDIDMSDIVSDFN